jgi:hypothetical protein
MFDSKVLETAIGLIFLFLGLAMATTAIQEFLASFFALRAKTLASGLQNMLADGKSGLDFYNKLIAHPAVSHSGKQPSYLSADQFSTAVLSILSGNGAVARTPAAINNIVRALPDTRTKQVLLSLLRDGEKDLSDFEGRLQQWFDDSMDRISGIYKRISQYISLAIGAVLAFGLQANAIAIGYGLWYGDNTKLMDAAKNTTSDSMNQALTALSQYHLMPIWDGIPKSQIGATWFLGCATTAFAVSLGAPFWFDLLQNFVNIRGTGPKPDRADANSS